MTKLKLQRLSPEELAREVETLKKELSNREAICKLEAAQQQLKKIVDEHPESPAAQSAKRMLDVEFVVPGNALVPVNSLPTY